MESLRRVLILLVVLAVTAEEEPFLGQREVTFEISELTDEDSQKPVEFLITDFFDEDLDMTQKKEVDNPEMPRHHAAGVPMFGPRSMGPPEIPFPLARPNNNNIQAICRYSNQRPRYPKEMLPSTGFGYIGRQAHAVNQLESWFSVCCSNGTEDEEQVLCCAEQAWKKSLSAFCDEEFSVKTSHYYCCRKMGTQRRTCFEKASPSHLQSYLPSGQGSWAEIPSVDEGFKFNPSSCHKHRSLIARRATRGRIPNIFFPPGRPNSDNIESICANNQQRRRFSSRCLQRKPTSGMTHQSKAINDLEKGFNQCCKKRKDKQPCAEMKWKMMVDDFCTDGTKTDLNQFDCCEKENRDEQYNCFAAAATNPGYNLNVGASVNQAHSSLDMFCKMYSTYHRSQRIIEVWDNFAGEMYKRCCISEEGENSACLQSQMNSILDEVCRESLWKNSDYCKLKGKARSKSVTKKVLHMLAEGLGLNDSTRKKCWTPL